MLWPWRMMELTCRFKTDMRNFTNFDLSTQKSKKIVLIGSNLWFEKWLEKFVKFSPEYLKVSRLGLWWDPFVQSRKGMTLKFAEELCVMAMKNNAKFEEELTCHFRTDRNLTNLDWATRKSKKFALWLAPLTKVYNFWAKKSTEELSDGTEDWCKVWRKTDLCF